MYMVAVPVVLYCAIYGGPLVEPGLNRVRARSRLATEMGNSGFGVCRVLAQGSRHAPWHGFLFFCHVFAHPLSCSSKGSGRT